MGVFWSALHEFALADAVTSGAVLVSHTELPSGGVEAGRALAARLGLTWSPAMSAEFSKESSINRAAPTQLHNFDRDAGCRREEWRSKLGESDIERIEQVASGTLAKVEQPDPPVLTTVSVRYRGPEVAAR